MHLSQLGIMTGRPVLTASPRISYQNLLVMGFLLGVINKQSQCERVRLPKKRLSMSVTRPSSSISCPEIAGITHDIHDLTAMWEYEFAHGLLACFSTSSAAALLLVRIPCNAAKKRHWDSLHFSFLSSFKWINEVRKRQSVRLF